MISPVERNKCVNIAFTSQALSLLSISFFCFTLKKRGRRTNGESRLNLKFPLNSHFNQIPAHFCFLMGWTGFGPYSMKNTKIVLLGQDHTAQFEEFATNEGNVD